ncbi:MAG: metallophosphoesterase [Lentisphaeria bacterium]|nr:MAG: metallophosphoesterase [Lentisphaeria bacterium]
MKIVHFSDPHAGGPAEDLLAYIDKRWVGVFNYNFRRKFRHDMTKLENAVRYILDTKPDVAVCTGDLTSTGQPGGVRAGAADSAPAAGFVDSADLPAGESRLLCEAPEVREGGQ